MSFDPQIVFTRARKGYDPREVNAVVEEMRREIADLKQRNETAKNTIHEYDVKLRQLAESSRRLEEERAKESARLYGIINKAEQIAEESEQVARYKAETIEREARRESEHICGKARLEAALTRTILRGISENMETFRQDIKNWAANTEIRLDDLCVLLNGVLEDVPVPADIDFNNIDMEYASRLAAGARPQTVSDPPDPYEAYLKIAEKKETPLKYTPIKTQSKIIARFGD